MSRFWWMLAAFAPACDTGARSGATFPDVSGAESIVVGYRRADLEVVAAPAGAAAIQFAAADSSDVELLAYAEVLADLGLEAGMIDRGAFERRLPRPARMFGASIRDGELSAWEERQAMSAELADFPIPGEPALPCVELEVLEQRQISKTFCAASSPDIAILCTREGLSRLGDDGLEPIITLASEPRGLAVEPDGRTFWVSTVGGDVFRGDLSVSMPAVERVFTTSTGVAMTWVAAGDSWVMGLTERGVVERFDGIASSVVYRFPDNHTLGAGIARVQDDEVVAVHQVFGIAVRFRGGEFVEEPVDGAELISFSTVAEIPGVGTVVGTEFGRFFVNDGTSWSELGSSPFGLRVHTIVPSTGGFFYGGELGNFGEYRSDFGFCPPINDVHPDDVWRILVRGDRIYLASRGGDAILVVARIE